MKWMRRCQIQQKILMIRIMKLMKKRQEMGNLSQNFNDFFPSLMEIQRTILIYIVLRFSLSSCNGYWYSARRFEKLKNKRILIYRHQQPEAPCCDWQPNIFRGVSGSVATFIIQCLYFISQFIIYPNTYSTNFSSILKVLIQ